MSSYTSGSRRESWPASGKPKRPGPAGVLTRIFDISVSLLAILFTLPFALAIALVIRLQGEGPVFFAHRRIGFQGREFNCLKFRSMVVDSDRRLQAFLATSPTARAEWERDHKLRQDPRITPIGSFLRKSSLDELPQLINVLRGEMSLVGPRPIVAAEIRRYGRYFRAYCSVRPGITGLWQVSGRNNVSYRRRVAMDVLYARRKGLLLNAKILLATIPAIALRRGAH